jgi:proline iminopeptidase
MSRNNIRRVTKTKKNINRQKKLSKKNNVSKLDLYRNTNFYPIIKPYNTGLLEVSSIHKIAHFCYGNKNGKPVLVVHGGPGASTSDSMARFFNPDKYMIILVDQRGCGKSTPFGELRNNTTNDLIEDFEKIRKYLKIDKWMVFGGSWGSTLSLAYSQTYPEKTTELILRGIFTGSKKEIDWFNRGHGASSIFPKAWKKYKNTIPEDEQNDLVGAYGKRFKGDFGKKEKYRAMLAWATWEDSCAHLIPTPQDTIKKNLLKNNMYIPFATIEYHYFSNNLFFKDDGHVLKQKNLDKIKKIPMVIVQGRYDMLCPNVTAHNLHKGCPKSSLILTTAGHSAYDEDTLNNLVNATDSFV